MNLSYQQLTALVCVAMEIASIDGHRSDEEILSIIRSLQEHYSLDEATFKVLITDARNMNLERALPLLRNLGSDEKQFASDLFAQVAVADGKLTEEEKEAYYQLVQLLELPVVGQNEQKDEFPVPVFASLYVGYGNLGNVRTNSIILWDLGNRPVHSMEELSRPIDTRKYPGDGRGPADEFYTKKNTKILTLLSEKMGFSGGDSLVYVFRKAGGDFNKPATLMNDGDEMFGSVYLCIRDSEGYVHGFKNKEELRYVLRALDILSDHECYSIIANTSQPRPTPEKLRKCHDEALASMLKEIDEGEIHSAAEALKG